jgi:hypothetical protein
MADGRSLKLIGILYASFVALIVVIAFVVVNGYASGTLVLNQERARDVSSADQH